MPNPVSNKQNAIAFYKAAYGAHPEEAFRLYAGDKYIQHNPLVADGTEPFIEYLKRMQKEYRDKSIEFVRAVAEGGLVALHTHQTWPGGGLPLSPLARQLALQTNKILVDLC